MDADISRAWCITGATVRGASHRRSGAPNQDAISWRSTAGPVPAAVLAVADGHGGPLYMRSQRGSRMAAHVAVTLLLEFAAAQTGQPALSAVKRLAADRLPRDLVRAWNERVTADLLSDPLGDRELDQVARRVGDQARDRLSSNPALAYGSTLLAALLTQEYVLAIQLGDGDILSVAEDGTASDWPLQRDSRLIANETTSLCSPEAWRSMRTYLQPAGPLAARLLILATDGYANSFEDRSGLIRAAEDILAAIRVDGLAAVGRLLPAWLRSTSSAGSGDDITVGLAYWPAST